jgi:subtilisin family serine protease
MAAPCVSGVLAMMFAVNPSLSAEQAINTLYATAHDLQSKGFDAETGWGEVDAKAAVQAAKATVGAMYFEDLNSDYTVDEKAVFFSNIAATTVSNIAVQYYTGSPSNQVLPSPRSWAKGLPKVSTTN